MTTIAELDCPIMPTTDGEIAIINLGSARQRSWARLFMEPMRDGVAEAAIEHEQLTLQFVGDVSALDRVEALASRLKQIDAKSARVALIQAQVASIAHRFSDARYYLARADLGGVPTADVERLRLNIDQACGLNLDIVLDARQRIANESGGLEDLVALGSLLADLRDFAGADQTYQEALHVYQEVSPFPIAQVSSNSVRFGANSRRSLIRRLPRSGIGRQLPSCRRTQMPACIWPKFVHRRASLTRQRYCFGG